MIVDADGNLDVATDFQSIFKSAIVILKLIPLVNFAVGCLRCYGPWRWRLFCIEVIILFRATADDTAVSILHNIKEVLGGPVWEWDGRKHMTCEQTENTRRNFSRFTAYSKFYIGMSYFACYVNTTVNIDVYWHLQISDNEVKWKASRVLTSLR